MPAGVYEEDMETFAPHKALDEIFKVIQRANKYIDENAPWALAKDMETNGTRLAHVLYNLLEATRICGILLTPFMPESCENLCPDRLPLREGRTWDAAAGGALCLRPLPSPRARTCSPAGHGQGPGGAGGRGGRGQRPPCPPSRWSPS